jgi:hypothetical protein
MNSYMILAEREILNLALEALHEKLALPKEMVILKEDTAHKEYDAIVQIMDVDFVCEVKNTVTTATVGNITNRLRALAITEKRPVLLIAKYITPTVMDDLATNGINTLDGVGNCHIRHVKGNKILFHLTNKGEKNTLIIEKPYPAFQEAGLKVIFYLLQDSLNVNKPYREIKNATGVSLGAIKNVLDVLVERNFLLLANGKRILKNKNVLFNLWVENYNQVLKPRLLLGKMSFRTDEQRIKWLAMELPAGMYWGGESGANMVETYLEPAVFDIYTDIPAAYLLKTGFVKQDENGEIRIYQKFWNWETENHLVPLILIYADLMGSGNSRCLETAERLLNHGLKDYK